MIPIEKIAKILRTDRDTVEKLVQKAERMTGKEHTLERILEANETLIKDRLQLKELGKSISAEEIYNALMEKIREDDLQLFKALGKPSFMLKEDVDVVLDKIKELVSPCEGFFLKKEKAIEFLKFEPPKKIISYLGYKDVGELINREDIFEIYAAIRLFENAAWFNDIFSKQYLNLKATDFEKRKIEMRA